MITLGLIAACVPVVKPWDSKYGQQFDVLMNGQIIFDMIALGVLVAIHFGTPCRSLTWARWPQLRTPDHPLGLPGLDENANSLVKVGNALADFTLRCCVALHELSGYFSVENPELSWLWLLPDFLMLESMEGVEFVRFLFKSYGVPFCKPTLCLHNTPTLQDLRVKVCPWVGETVHLRGLVWFEGQWTFRTHLAEAYPPALGIQYGQLMATALRMRAQALEAKSPVPHASREQGEGESGQLPFRLRESLRCLMEDEEEPGLTESMEELVPNGMGAPVGLEPLDHVQWALTVDHPAASPPSKVTVELSQAIEFESKHSADEIDSFRNEKLYQYVRLAKDMEKARADWCNKSHTLNRPVVEQIHGPLLKALLAEASGSEDTFQGLLQDCLQGFPLVGDLPPCEGATIPGVPKSFPKTRLDTEDLRSNRKDYNKAVLAKLKELPHSEDILPQAQKDAAQGFMTNPRLLKEEDVEKVNLTRRIPVREERESGWRTRVVDHKTESMINTATRPFDKLQHDDIDVLAFIVTCFLILGILPKLWKRDISSAFRRVPIWAEHLDLAWVCWITAGRIWVAQHLGMPFGTVSAVYAWHRVGHALLFIVLVLFKAPMARYVDDYFGCSRDGVVFSGGVCLTIVASLLGFPTDEAKSADDLIRMVVLGASVWVNWPGRSFEARVADAKAEKWSKFLKALLEVGVCNSADAASMAGRLSFTVTLAANRVGRAFIKPFYAQQHAPLPGGAIGAALENAIIWFLAYLEARPAVIRKGLVPRKLVVTWHDAAGVSRWVAAVVRHEGVYLWTRIRTPDHVWQQLQHRDDSQIGFQELLGIVLLLGSFHSLLQGSLWLSFGDNDGVTHSLARGGGHNPECNVVIGKVWLAISELDLDLHAARVESHANIADGPSRDFFEYIHSLQATYVEPHLPTWIDDIWLCDVPV